MPLSSLTHSILTVAFGVLLITLLLALAQADIERLVLPNLLNFALGMGGLAQSFALGAPSPADAILGALFGGIFMGATALGYRSLRGFDGLGMGDIKLVGAAGLWIGWEGIPLMLLFASLTALAYVLGRLLVSRSIGLRTRLPFGPFLGGGTLVTWLLCKVA